MPNCSSSIHGCLILSPCCSTKVLIFLSLSLELCMFHTVLLLSPVNIILFLCIQFPCFGLFPFMFLAVCCVLFLSFLLVCFPYVCVVFFIGFSFDSIFPTDKALVYFPRVFLSFLILLHSSVQAKSSPERAKCCHPQNPPRFSSQASKILSWCL